MQWIETRDKKKNEMNGQDEGRRRGFFLEGLEKFFLRKQMRSDQGMKRKEIEGIPKKKIEHKGGERKEEEWRKEKKRERKGKRLKE